MCVIIKPKMKMSTNSQRLYVDITFSPGLKEMDQPRSILGWFTSENGWYGLISDDWLTAKPKQFNIPFLLKRKPTRFF